MMHLDGNAAAGVLMEIFGRDMTSARETCAHCGSSDMIAEAHVYMNGPGTVLRCPNCDDMLMAIAWTGSYSVDVMGISRIEMPA
jgi:ribosomal protein S27AE